MQWPSEIVAAFERAVRIEPADGWTSAHVLQALLDETARRAVWRAQGDPARISGALRWPYTPLGSLCADGVDGRANKLMIFGSLWGAAVDALHGYIEQNAQMICDVFRDEMEPYDDHT